MAIIKHIRSKNANYSNATDYLIFQHNEITGKPILDDMGRMIPRKEYFLDGINCDPNNFAAECMATNKHFNKNQKHPDIKSHHFIISFDPADVTEYNLTGERAQALCLEFARNNFPGFQTLVVTHTDGHNHSGNIHTHIVINSVRKFTVEHEEYMTQPNDHMAGYKHRNTPIFLQHLQKEVMTMCECEGLHQVDLLSPATKKITQQEYMAQRSGQHKLDELNKQIIADGFMPTTTVYKTQKQFLRDAIDECSSSAENFKDFQSLLLEKYNISVIESRGRYRYLHPDRDKRTTEKALGSHYGKQYLEQIFGNSEQVKTAAVSHSDTVKVEDYRRDPIMILYYKSQLRLVTDLQTNVKAMQNQAYARKVKISNLQQMANTIIFIQEHGYDTQDDLTSELTSTKENLEQTHIQLSLLSEEMKLLNSRIHYTIQYLSNKKHFVAFLKSPNKNIYHSVHKKELETYHTARKWLAKNSDKEYFLSLKELKQQRMNLQCKFRSNGTPILKSAVRPF